MMIKNRIKYITSKMNLRLLEFYRYIKINGKLRGRSKFDMDKFYNVALWYTRQIYKLTMYATRTRNP